MTLRLTLPHPPTANKRLILAKGKRRMILAQSFRDYYAKVAVIVNLKKPKKFKPFDGPVVLTVYWHPPDKRKRDQDNVLKAIKDSLTKARIWKDDSQVKEMHMYTCEPDRLKGKVNVEIRKKGEDNG